MNQKLISKSLAVLAISMFLFVANPVRAQTEAKSIAGSYLALLDLGAFGAPRIETFYMILGRSGALLYTSEHESDKESPGVGVWKRLQGGEIGLGAASFRFGPDPASSVCALIAVVSPPDNCVLKIGGTVSQQADGSLAGELFLTVENLDGTVDFEFPGDVPISMTRLRLEDFPGALP